ncbi:MAG: hypothetical protein JHC95_11215 [Solirubrobacteraceae bacterium]|nr:hypothetical protein [Solirubrobacteraceae bacterium]
MRVIHGAVGLVCMPALVFSLAACGDERSPEAYCRAFYEHAAPIRRGYVDAGNNAKSNPIEAIATILASPGDLVTIFDAMVDHAPDEIQSDTEEVRDSFKRAQEHLGEAASNPLGALGAGLIGSMTSAGASRRVDAYLNEHCPVDSPLAQEYIDAAEK